MEVVLGPRIVKVLAQGYQVLAEVDPGLRSAGVQIGGIAAHCHGVLPKSHLGQALLFYKILTDLHKGRLGAGGGVPGVVEA